MIKRHDQNIIKVKLGTARFSSVRFGAVLMSVLLVRFHSVPGLCLGFEASCNLESRSTRLIVLKHLIVAKLETEELTFNSMLLIWPHG